MGDQTNIHKLLENFKQTMEEFKKEVSKFNEAARNAAENNKKRKETLLKIAEQKGIRISAICSSCLKQEELLASGVCKICSSYLAMIKVSRLER